jgi:alpha-galactosidase
VTADQSSPDEAESLRQEREVHLPGDGVSLVLDARDGLPSVLHWGANLGELTDEALRDLAAAARPQARPELPMIRPDSILLLYVSAS